MDDVTVAGARRNVGRALRRRCPNCGAPDVWKNWLVMRERCPSCGLRFDRGEPDYFLGVYLVNFVVAELGFAVLFVMALVVTWPNVPWRPVTIGSVIVAVVAPFITYPYSRGVWLGLDLLFRPEKGGEI